MIIQKTKDGRYMNEMGMVMRTRKEYLEEKACAENMKEPSEKELIELGKMNHIFYKKQFIVDNAENNIKEMDAFDAKEE